MDVVRITELQPKTYVEQGDYIAIDNQGDGTKKVQFTNLLDDTLSQENKIAPANVVGDEIATIRDEVEDEIATIRAAVGSPLKASTVAQMKDKNKIYVYVGSESGYTNGNWYYWNGSAWTSGGVYNSVAVVTDPTLTLSGVPADAKATGDEIGDLKSELNDTNAVIASGILQLTSDNFEQGTYTNDGTKSGGSRVIRCKNAYPIHCGDKLITEASALYMGWYLLDSLGNLVETGFGYSTYRVKIKNQTYTFTHDGTLYLTVANGFNQGNSSDIIPSDMTASISIINTYASREITSIKGDVSELQTNSAYLFNKILDESASASSTSYLYYPYNFVVGQTYVVKIKFSAFVSTYSRKYSLRTTTAQYISSGYTVQMVAQVDGTNPALETEYVYTFTAKARPDGGLPKYLALELSVTGESACTFEVYSIKAEDAQTDIDKLNYLTATDIVSLNHDVPALIRQGLKPFNRATTQPLSLTLFSDIHGNATNLQRIVDMGESLESLIDDVVCGGDMVANNYSATCMDFWNGVDGAENILLCVGNHDLADGQHGYSSDQIGQTVAYQKYFSPYVSNWDVTMAGENLTYWYKDYASKKVRLIALNYLLTGAEQTAQNTWLASRLAEAKTNEYAVVILEHTPLNSFAKVDCNFSIIGLNWGYSEFPTIYQDTVQSFIDGGGEFACYLAGHCHCDYVGYNSNYPDQLCVAVTTAQTTGFDNDQRRVAGEKSQDAMDIVLVDTVTKTVKLIRVGADMDCYLRGRNLFSINYNTKVVIANS